MMRALHEASVYVLGHGPNLVCCQGRGWCPGGIHGSKEIKEPLEQVVWQVGVCIVLSSPAENANERFSKIFSCFS